MATAKRYRRAAYAPADLQIGQCGAHQPRADQVQAVLSSGLRDQARQPLAAPTAWRFAPAWRPWAMKTARRVGDRERVRCIKLRSKWHAGVSKPRADR